MKTVRTKEETHEKDLFVLFRRNVNEAVDRNDQVFFMKFWKLESHISFISF